MALYKKPNLFVFSQKILIIDLWYLRCSISDITHLVMLHSSIIEFLFSVNATVKMHICLVYSLTNFKFILLKLTKEGEFASC